MIAAFLAGPLFARIAPYFFGFLIVVGAGLVGYSVVWHIGYAAKAAEVAKDQAVAERARDLDRIRRTEKGEQIAEAVIEVREKTRVIYRNIIKEVPRYVPSDACPMPAGFRVLHDAAAEGRSPEAPGSTDAAPVPAQDVATTVVENYEAARDNADRLRALQQWVREVTQ